MLLLLLSARGIFSEAARLIIYPIGIQNLKDAKTSAESRSGDFPESRWTETEIASENRQRQFFQISERRLSDKADKLFYKGNLFDHVFLPRIQLKAIQQVSLEYIIIQHKR